tara:strand:- start:173 stop:748 length:576 start_codon:yes stop_codon:yes gene_type:complete
MKKLDIPKSTFIGGYFIKDDVSSAMKNLFDSHPQHIKPTKMDATSKVCTEFAINPWSNCFSPIYEYMQEVNNCIETYVDEFIPFMGSKVLRWEWTAPFNIQHYKKGEGFYKWHYERMSNKEIELRRSLVFMTYLNDVDDGGTEFLNQKCEVKARKNLTLIWPSDWTHIHRGVISHTKEKTIVTGWISLYKP